MTDKYRIIALEGLDGTGKTSLANWFKNKFSYEILKSPTANFANNRRQFDANKDIRERFSFYIGASFYTSILIEEMLLCHKNIVVDRYYYSTLAYHYVFDNNMVNRYKKFCVNLMKPDLIIFLKSDYELATNRILGRKLLANDSFLDSEKKFLNIENAYSQFFDTKTISVENNSTFIDLINQVQILL